MTTSPMKIINIKPHPIRLLMLSIVLLSMSVVDVWATHIRAGELTAIRIGGAASLRYRFTLTVYTDITSQVNNPTADIVFGDGDAARVGRNGPPVSIPSAETNINQYVVEHTYPGPGAYLAFYTEVNRNLNVINMANSGQTNFYVETRITIDPLLGANSSPILLNPPVDQGALRRVYRHNPGAFDPDGDSLSYELTASQEFIPGIGGQTVSGWLYPDAAAGGNDSSNTRPARMTIDPRTGQLTWDVPNNFVGEYNIAIKIIEWRRNRFNRMIQLGYVIRDMQIIIRDSPNRPPKLLVPNDICVVAGTRISGDIIATDEDAGTTIDISATGGPLTELVAPSTSAVLTRRSQVVQRTVSNLTWQTSCNDVREQPYQFVFKATENSPLLPKLVDLKTWSIKVYAPRPRGLRATAAADAITLTWRDYNASICNQVNGARADSILIYRRADSTLTDTSGCQPGMPPSTGYVKIGSVPASQTTYLDDNRGQGLQNGIFYSYRLVAKFPSPKGGLSFPSDQAKARLRLTRPNLIRLSVNRTDINNGEVSVVWTKPVEPDTAVYKLPYSYILKRRSANTNNQFIDVLTTSNWASDTTFTDTNLNTQDAEATYQLWFKYKALTQSGLVDREVLASEGTTVRTIAAGGPRQILLVWEATTPWQNFQTTQRDQNGVAQPFRHIIRREINGQFEAIDSVVVNGRQGRYTDNGTYNGIRLNNGQQYRYQIVTRGGYTTSPLPVTLVNLSQIAIGSPVDTTTPPAPDDTTVCNPRELPKLIVKGCNDCGILQNPAERFNLLTWTFDTITNPCDSGLVSYNIYYKPTINGSYSRVGQVPAQQLEFRHQNNGSLAGCYYLTATNRFGRESRPTQVFCADNCPLFDLPNVITPGVVDGKNDVFKPFCSIPDFVAEIETKIYNRYGQEVYTTKDPEINWAGLTKPEAGEKLPAGTYFYLSRVKFIRLDDSIPPIVYKGWVQLAY